MNDGPEWFAPKRYGYGSGLPIAWQGWAVYSGYFALLGIATLLIRHHTLAGYFSVVIMLTVALMVICARTTKGGWRWRWGHTDD